VGLDTPRERQSQACRSGNTMRRLGSNARTILGLFDEGLGGLGAPASIVALILQQRGIRIRKTNLLLTLDRLSKSGELSKVKRPKGGAVYTRPRNLTQIPAFYGMLEGLPTTDIRRRPGTSDRRWELRKKRALKAEEAEEIRRGPHVHRDPARPCPVPGCWAWPPERAERKIASFERKARSMQRRAAGAQVSGSESASPAKSA
jgi:hypothetical protein